MSAIPEDCLRPGRDRARHRQDADTPAQKFWLWFALAALVFGWIAEATMCAERGF